VTRLILYFKRELVRLSLYSNRGGAVADLGLAV
jgi:hypothetical protein